MKSGKRTSILHEDLSACMSLVITMGADRIHYKIRAEAAGTFDEVNMTIKLD
jgi:hypothetical protein